MGRSPVTVWAEQKGDHLEEMDKRNTVAHLFTKQARSALPRRPQDLKCTCPKGMICGGQELVKPSARPRSLFKDNRKGWPSHLWLEGVPCVYQNGSCLCTVDTGSSLCLATSEISKETVTAYGVGIEGVKAESLFCA